MLPGMDVATASEDRYFGAEPSRRRLARQLYDTVRDRPIISPHGHVRPVLLADPAARFGSPAELFVIPDHYVFRMLYSQGLKLESLGVPRRDGQVVATDHRTIWRRFLEHFHLFRATPSALWVTDELRGVFGITDPIDVAHADAIYDELVAKLAQPAFSPRALFERFRIETLATTDAATDTLDAHRQLAADAGWAGRVRPTFRPDSLMQISADGWAGHVAQLSERADVPIRTYAQFVQAIEARRQEFRRLGATATDHAVVAPRTLHLRASELEAIFRRALGGRLRVGEAEQFQAHFLVEMARMSTEDGLVMQLHAGSFRNHNAALAAAFGPDVGADIPVAVEWTENLKPLLDTYGSDARFRLIVFTLDETNYSRELAPIAGHYPAVLLGPPWWFHDSVLGIRRYLDAVVETAGFQNTAGFNDDTRAFLSIPARHDLWRRVTCDWLAGLIVEARLDEASAAELALDCSDRLARRAYRLEPAA